MIENNSNNRALYSAWANLCLKIASHSYIETTEYDEMNAKAEFFNNSWHIDITGSCYVKIGLMTDYLKRFDSLICFQRYLFKLMDGDVDMTFMLTNAWSSFPFGLNKLHLGT